MAAPGYNLGTGTFGGSFNPYIGRPASDTISNDRQRRLASGEALPTGTDGMYIAALPGNPLQGGGMMGTTNPDGTTTVGAGQFPSDQLLGSGIAGLNLSQVYTGAVRDSAGNITRPDMGASFGQPTNPYSTGYGMGYQQQPNQQPNQQPMGGGKGGTQSGGGKGGAQ